MHRDTGGEQGVLTYLCHFLGAQFIHPQMYSCMCLSGILLCSVGFHCWSVSAHLVVVQNERNEENNLLSHAADVTEQENCFAGCELDGCQVKRPSGGVVLTALESAVYGSQFPTFR